MIPLYQKIKRRINAYRGIPPSVEELKNQVNRFLPRNPVILEAGAHLGFDTYGLSKCWPNGTIWAFEPVPAIYHELAKRIGKQKMSRRLTSP